MGLCQSQCSRALIFSGIRSCYFSGWVVIVQVLYSNPFLLIREVKNNYLHGQDSCSRIWSEVRCLFVQSLRTMLVYFSRLGEGLQSAQRKRGPCANSCGKQACVCARHQRGFTELHETKNT